MAVAAQEEAQRPTCWCCGNAFDEHDLTRLGTHPEVGVCAACARWLSRRARSTADADVHTVGAVVHRPFAATRDLVVRAGLQDWPLLGRVLRRLDRHLP
ncbi:hypothetical protein [Terrabacter sp. C0L_2]|uniref:hypothetical protein n=1 Tax=Terrabacter sp. C0L_2 TaxID=3108389 RepID=UPI002ED4230E|nr:hypothetical protein U5C87_15965 [Terrabacter sp. C0L_2]